MEFIEGLVSGLIIGVLAGVIWGITFFAKEINELKGRTDEIVAKSEAKLKLATEAWRKVNKVE
jgi:MFS superfamily sulfate permease-like transporter